jgi:hypothetical protein
MVRWPTRPRAKPEMIRPRRYLMEALSSPAWATPATSAAKLLLAIKTGGCSRATSNHTRHALNPPARSFCVASLNGGERRAAAAPAERAASQWSATASDPDGRPVRGENSHSRCIKSMTRWRVARRLIEHQASAILGCRISADSEAG